MRLASRAYRILWEAHAWAGAVASVLLVGMFLLGVVSLFHHELAPWQEPRLRAPVAVDEARMLATLQRALDARSGPDAPKRLDVDLPSEHAPWLRLGWKEADGSARAVWVHPGSGEEAPERSDLGNFVFLMHFLYPLPHGMLVAGLIATATLLVVLSGLLLQLGRLWRELVRFRPTEALRTVWGDLHKVLGSVGLPFQAVIAWTAAIVCLNATVLQPVVVHTAFDGNLDAGLASIGYPRGPKALGQPGRAPDVAAALVAARAALPDVQHGRLTIHGLGDAGAYVDVRGNAGKGLAEFTRVRVAADGQVLHVREAGGPSAVSRVVEGAYVLHSGTFGDMGLRVVWGLLGLLGTLCIVTGNLIWLERRARSPRLVDAALARLTAGGCGGAAFALAALLLANQLLPEGLDNRPAWEHGALYGGWCLAVLGSLLVSRPATSARVLLLVSGVTLLLLPLLDAVLNGRRPLDAGGSPHVLWTEVGLLVLGSAFVVAAQVVHRLSRRASAGVPQLQPQPTPEAP